MPQILTKTGPPVLDLFPNIPPLSLARFDDAATNLFDLAMVRKHVNASVAPAEERAQQPTDQRNDDCAKNRAPKTVNLEAWNDLAHELQHQRVNDQNEQPQRHQNERNAEEKENRPHEGINDPQQQRRAQQATDPSVIYSHNWRRHKDRKRRHEPAKNEMPHGQRYYDSVRFAQTNAQGFLSLSSLKGGEDKGEELHLQTSTLNPNSGRNLIVAKKSKADSAASEKVGKMKTGGRSTSSKGKKSSSANKTGVPKTGRVPTASAAFDPTDEQIQTRAYFISERRRRFDLPGDANSDWLEAKRQLLSEVGPR